ncbi:uncharacterized protein HKW66_Vig0047330 [Vigna angularis]|uniref:Uncharacterized protein n=1 Tax=Phaseolus angularis TaxID=3914 RepID=A0A8T0L3C7_PHAAN|nr:uncharacterized protein HKW66_Vig0047330 [Vigna angularis]
MGLELKKLSFLGLKFGKPSILRVRNREIELVGVRTRQTELVGVITRETELFGVRTRETKLLRDNDVTWMGVETNAKQNDQFMSMQDMVHDVVTQHELCHLSNSNNMEETLNEGVARRR